MSYQVRKAGSGRRLYTGVGGSVARAIDAILAPIAPAFVARRQRAFAETRQALNYDAAARRDTRFDRRASSADQDLLRDLPTLRRNSRAMVRDGSTGAAILRVLEDNVIGTGLVPQMMLDGESVGISESEADDWNRSVEQLWTEIAKQIDASEHDSFAAMQGLVLRTNVIEGEAFLHRVWIDEPQRRVVGSAWEMIDCDRIVDPPSSDGREIRAGVEVGDRQNAVAYWVTPRHPDESTMRYRDERRRRNRPERVPRIAGGQPSVLHVFSRRRTGQTRGEPFLTSSYGVIESAGDMLEAELEAVRGASKFAMFIEQTVDADEIGGLQQDSEGRWYEEVENATIRYLNKGEKPHPYTPNRPGSTFEPFMVLAIRSACAAMGLPYELVLKNFARMNYSSARVALLEARRGFEVMQQRIIEQLCEPIFRLSILEAVLNRKLRMPRGFLEHQDRFLRAYWQPPAWGWVDPVKEVESSRLAIESNLSTPQREAARQGGDSETNLIMRARHLKRAREIEAKHGLPEGSLTDARPAPTPPAPQAPEEEGDTDTDTEDQ